MTLTLVLTILTILAFTIFTLTAVVTISDINKKRKIEMEQEYKKHGKQLEMDLKEPQVTSKKRVEQHA